MTATSAVCTDKSVLQEGQEGQEERNKSPYLLSLLLMLLASGWRPNKAQTRALRAYFGGAAASLTAAIRCRQSATADREPTSPSRFRPFSPRTAFPADPLFNMSMENRCDFVIVHISPTTGSLADHRAVLHPFPPVS